MTGDPELAICPRCNRAPIFHAEDVQYGHGSRGRAWYVRCGGCGMRTDAVEDYAFIDERAAKSRAADMWNGHILKAGEVSEQVKHTCAVIGPANIRKVVCGCTGRVIEYRFDGMFVTVLSDEKLEIDDHGTWWIKPLVEDPGELVIVGNADVKIRMRRPANERDA